VTTVDVYDRAADGDRRALGAIEEQAATMAKAVVAVHSILDPQLVVFGGGIGSRRDFAARVREHLPRLTNRKLPVEISALGERAGVLGAAEVALASVAQELEEPVR
jgi:predicted NBD/HSP70 family sugar kinase